MVLLHPGRFSEVRHVSATEYGWNPPWWKEVCVRDHARTVAYEPLMSYALGIHRLYDEQLRGRGWFASATQPTDWYNYVELHFDVCNMYECCLPESYKKHYNFVIVYKENPAKMKGQDDVSKADR